MMKNSYSGIWGEQGPTIIMDTNLAAHKGDSYDLPSYGSWNSHQKSTSDTNNIRFQVIIWSIDRPDMTLSRVSMKFRVTLFWNINNRLGLSRKGSFCRKPESFLRQSSLSRSNHSLGSNNKTTIEEEGIDSDISDSEDLNNDNASGHWVMEGRNRAKFRTVTPLEQQAHMEVPPLSIINAESFSIIGAPDVSLLRESDGLMRWTCLYRATLLQNDMKVNHFPHDEHNLVLRLGILQNRHPGGIWDRKNWKLGLANRDDSRGSTRVPHGLIVDNVQIPEFSIDEKSPTFEFAPLPFGPGGNCKVTTEECLEVKVRVLQESGYYDKNIMPLFIVIGFVAMFVIACLDVEEFFQRGLMLLNCAFVEVGLRMTLDSRLPRVRYQIKMQRILNEFFFILFFLVMESGVVHLLVKYNICGLYAANRIDILAVIAALYMTVKLSKEYYENNRSKGYKFHEEV